jgi:hypothetical protein
MSLAQRHQMRVLSEQATANAAPGSTVDRTTSNAHALIRAKLDTDRRRLKAVQSIERKIDIKREVLPEYTEYVDGVLAAGNGVQDDVLGYVMCWRIDAGDFTGALAIGRYVLQHDILLPDRFERTTATLIAEEPAIAALKACDGDKPFDLDVLHQVFELTADRDMPDQVRAKLHFAIGRHMAKAGDDDAGALVHLRRAVELHDKVGAKKDIEQLERKLRNASGEAGKKQPPKSGT